MTTHSLHYVTGPPTVISDPESHDLETDKHEVFGLHQLEAPDCDIWHDPSPPILYK